MKAFSIRVACASTHDPLTVTLFIAHPPTYVQSGAGAFEWQFRTSTPGSSTGAVAYKLSTESVWHRCNKDLPGAPEQPARGRVLDHSRRRHQSGLVRRPRAGLQRVHAAVLGQPDDAAPQTTPTTAMLYVDATPPTVTEPGVITAGLDALVSVEASDGSPGSQVSSGARATGLLLGEDVHSPHVPARRDVERVGDRDRPRRQPERAPVHGHGRASATGPAAPAPAPPAPVDKIAPGLRVNAAARQLMRARGAAVMTVRCSELRRGRRGRVADHRRSPVQLRTARRSLAAGESRTLRLALNSGTRQALSQASRRHRRVRATLRVVATDSAGNRQRRPST